jgi:hypothetical protein
MRRFVLTLMMALLPLSGWTGDAMAIEMAAATLETPTFAIETGADHARTETAAAVFDSENTLHANCHDHVAALDDTAHADSNCSTCSACHSLALAPTLTQAASVALSAPQPQAAEPFFASAERAPGFKPPIS